MLRIDLGALHHGPIEMGQVVNADDTLFEGLEFRLSKNVHLHGRLMEAGGGRYYWHGRLETQVQSPCRRCLATVTVEVKHPIDVLFTEDHEVDDPASYVIPPRAMEIDPGDAVREELMLSVPDYVLCKEECKGLCAGCGTDLNSGSCKCKSEPDQRWAALEAFKAVQQEEGRE